MARKNYPTKRPPAAARLIERALHYLENELRQAGALLSSADAVREYLTLRLARLEHEVFYAIWLDGQHRLIDMAELFRGTINETKVYTREVVKEAMWRNAAAVIFAHNHPSRVAEPSPADYTLTDALRQTLAPLDVRILDHFVVGGTQVVSIDACRAAEETAARNRVMEDLRARQSAAAKAAWARRRGELSEKRPS